MPQGHQDDRRGHADGRVGRQDADSDRRQAHDHDGHEEGVLAPDHVAEAAEHQRPERPHEEARRESQQRGDERGRRVERGEELLGDDPGQRSVQVEVVPLENGAEARREDDPSLFLRHRSGDRLACGNCCCDHVLDPSQNVNRWATNPPRMLAGVHVICRHLAESDRRATSGETRRPTASTSARQTSGRRAPARPESPQPRFRPDRGAPSRSQCGASNHGSPRR